MIPRPPPLTRRRLGQAGLAIAGIAGATTLAAPTPAAPSGGREPLLGTYGGAGCTGAPYVAKFETFVGRKMDVVLDFLQMDTWKGMVGEAGWICGCWKGAGHRNLVISVPMLVGEGRPTLEQGAQGQFDGHFRDLAASLVGNGYPDPIIRIGWEFNGGWYPWTARGKPAAYAAYWRRIAQVMRATPGARFRFDWTATTTDGPTEQAYPGDDVVDIIGLDIYNQSWPLIADPGERWQYLRNHPAGLQWHRRFAASRGKPRSFPEWGTGTRPDGHGGGDDPLFVRNMLAWMRQDGPVVYACYWNYRAPDYDAKVSDGRLPQAADALRAGLRGTG